MVKRQHEPGRGVEFDGNAPVNALTSSLRPARTRTRSIAPTCSEAATRGRQGQKRDHGQPCRRSDRVHPPLAAGLDLRFLLRPLRSRARVPMAICTRWPAQWYGWTWARCCIPSPVLTIAASTSRVQCFIESSATPAPTGRYLGALSGSSTRRDEFVKCAANSRAFRQKWRRRARRVPGGHGSSPVNSMAASCVRDCGAGGAPARRDHGTNTSAYGLRKMAATVLPTITRSSQRLRVRMY